MAQLQDRAVEVVGGPVADAAADRRRVGQASLRDQEPGIGLDHPGQHERHAVGIGERQRLPVGALGLVGVAEPCGALGLDEAAVWRAAARDGAGLRRRRDRDAGRGR